MQLLQCDIINSANKNETMRCTVSFLFAEFTNLAVEKCALPLRLFFRQFYVVELHVCRSGIYVLAF